MDRSSSARSSDRSGPCSGRGLSRAGLRSGCVRSIGQLKKTVVPSAAEGPAFRSSVADVQPSTVDRMSPQLQLVQQERRFYFIGRTQREVIFSVLADSLDEARQKFRASGRPDSDALFIIKTETEIYLA